MVSMGLGNACSSVQGSSALLIEAFFAVILSPSGSKLNHPGLISQTCGLPRHAMGRLEYRPWSSDVLSANSDAHKPAQADEQSVQARLNYDDRLVDSAFKPAVSLMENALIKAGWRT